MPPEKKKRVYYEDTKARHTTHWDMDYLSQAELEALYSQNRRLGGAATRKPKRLAHRTILLAILVGSMTLLLAALFLLLLL